MGQRRVLVTGANGFVGRHMVREFLSRGVDTVCFIREGTSDEALGGPDVQVRRGDLRDGDSVEAAVSGTDAVVHLAAAVTASAKEHHRVNVEGARNVVRACHANGVDRLIAFSSVTVTRSRVGTYGLSKRRAESITLDSALNPTIFRPELIYGVGSPGLRKLTRQITAYPFLIPVVSKGEVILQPVYVKDVARLTADAIDDPRTHHKAYDVGGPDRVRVGDLVLMIARELGVRKWLLPVPPPVALGIAHALRMFPGGPPFTVDNMLGLMAPNNNDVGRTMDELGFSPMALEAGLRETFREAGQQRG